MLLRDLGRSVLSVRAGRRRGHRAVPAMIAALLLSLAAARPAIAGDAAFFGGGEVDDRGQGYAYSGFEVAQSVRPPLSLAGRVVLNYLTYKYPSGDHLIRASVPGVAGLVGIKLGWERLSFGIFGGAEYRNTDLDPDDRGSRSRGEHVSGTVQGEFDTWLPTRTNLNLFASYSGVADFVYIKPGVKQQLTNLDFSNRTTLNAGIEGIFGRNDDYNMRGVGLVIEMFDIPWTLSVAVRGGYKHDSNFGSGGYGGLSVYKKF